MASHLEQLDKGYTLHGITLRTIKDISFMASHLEQLRIFMASHLEQFPGHEPKDWPEETCK